MLTLPFTVYGFQLYSVEDAENLLSGAGFVIMQSQRKKEIVKSNSGESVERSFVIMSCLKPLL
jgi:hypothetical protein